MFMDGVDEFYKCFMERINAVLFNENRDRNVSRSERLRSMLNPRLFLQKTLDVVVLEKAYVALTGSSLTSLHNYYKNEIIHRNRFEIQRLKATAEEYEKLVEENESRL